METWLLEDYTEGLLGVAETAILEAHLAVCEDCRRELTHIKLLFWEMESVRREPVPVPDALKGIESAILNEWLTDKETWLQRAGLQLAASAKQTVAMLPRIPGVERVATEAAVLTGTASKKAAKWAGKTAIQQIRRKIRSTAAEKGEAPGKSGRIIGAKRINHLLSGLIGGGG